jgi:hypothetical protein
MERTGRERTFIIDRLEHDWGVLKGVEYVRVGNRPYGYTCLQVRRPSNAPETTLAKVSEFPDPLATADVVGCAALKVLPGRIGARDDV